MSKDDVTGGEKVDAGDSEERNGGGCRYQSPSRGDEKLIDGSGFSQREGRWVDSPR